MAPWCNYPSPAVGEFFRECCPRYSTFSRSSILKILDLDFPRASRRNNLLESKKSGISSNIEYYSMYSISLTALSTPDLDFTRLDFLKKFPDSILDLTRLDLVEEVYSSGELAHAWSLGISAPCWIGMSSLPGLSQQWERVLGVHGAAWLFTRLEWLPWFGQLSVWLSGF